MSPSNHAADEIDAAIHSVIMGCALSAAISAAKNAQPWLNFPIISQLFTWACTYSIGYFEKFLEQAAAFAVIDGQAETENADYQTALAQLKAAKDADAHAKALQNVRDTLAKLISYDGG